MAADDIGLRALDLDIRRTRAKPRLAPAHRLRGRHVEIRALEGLLLRRRDPLRLEVARAASGEIFAHDRVEALRRRVAVARLVLLAARVDLRRAHALRERARRRDRVLAPQRDEPHLQRRHLRARAQAHRVASARIERRIPHRMARRARMVGPVEARRAARRADDGARAHIADRVLAQVDAPGAGDAPVRRFQEIHDIDMLQHADILRAPHGGREQRLDVLAVDLDVAPAARDVVPVRVLQDDEPELLHAARDLVEPLGHREQQVVAHDARCVRRRVVRVVLRRMPGRDIRVECVDAGRETAAALDARFVDEQDRAFRPLRRERERRVAAGGTAADDEDI